MWVRARRGKRITGTTLHVAVWAPDRPGTVLVPGTGRYVPLCGAQWAPDRWWPTGPGWSGWERHAHWPVCSRCVDASDAIRSALVEQFRNRILTLAESGVAHPVDTP